MALSGATIWGPSEPGSNGNGSAFPKALPSLELHHQILVSYPGHLLGGGGSYPTAKVQLVYSTAPADWAMLLKVKQKGIQSV